MAAKTLRGVIREMDRKFPGLAETLEEETTVAIDGELYEIDFLRPVRPGAEVFFIPKIEGGCQGSPNRSTTKYSSTVLRALYFGLFSIKELPAACPSGTA